VFECASTGKEKLGKQSHDGEEGTKKETACTLYLLLLLLLLLLMMMMMTAGESHSISKRSVNINGMQRLTELYGV
jgi:hypothetical protein